MASRPLARLRHSQATRDKISNSKKGIPRSEEVKAKIAATMLGRKHSPETIAKLTAARRARKILTDAEVAEACLKRNRALQMKVTDVRLNRWKLDLFAAARAGNLPLLQDVRQSTGNNNARKLKGYPGVSDGYCFHKKKILWSSK